MALSSAIAGEAYHPNRLIVRFRSQPTTASLGSFGAKAGAAEVRPLFQYSTAISRTAFGASTFLYVFGDSTQRLAAESVLVERTWIASVERDYKMELFFDPLFENQWGLRNQGQSYLGISGL